MPRYRHLPVEVVLRLVRRIVWRAQYVEEGGRSADGRNLMVVSLGWRQHGTVTERCADDLLRLSRYQHMPAMLLSGTRHRFDTVPARYLTVAANLHRPGHDPQQPVHLRVVVQGHGVVLAQHKHRHRKPIVLEHADIRAGCFGGLLERFRCDKRRVQPYLIDQTAERLQVAGKLAIAGSGCSALLECGPRLAEDSRKQGTHREGDNAQRLEIRDCFRAPARLGNFTAYHNCDTITERSTIFAARVPGRDDVLRIRTGSTVNTFVTISMLRRFSPAIVDAFFLRFSPGISSRMPTPRACLSFGSDSWNTPTEAVDAFAMLDAVMSCSAQHRFQICGACQASPTPSLRKH
uniref:Uncharacterized protein n=1 Tax=Anopheles farauti TaxID=69004 RepID=A0A182QZS7_9DIPT